MTATLDARLAALPAHQQTGILQQIEYLEWKNRLPGCKGPRPAPRNDSMAKRLRYVRETLRQSEEVAARVAGVMLATYTRYEQGIIGRWATNAMMGYCDTWNVNLNWLTEGVGPMFGEGGPPQLPEDRKGFETELREAFDAIPEHLHGCALADARLESARRIIAAPQNKRSRRPAPASNLIDFKTAAKQRRARKGGDA